MAPNSLFIGRSYVDNVVLVDHLPSGDEKILASDHCVSFGGNAVTAAFACARLGLPPALLTTYADDWYGRLLMEMYSKYNISELHPRHVESTAFSIVWPNNGDRAMIRARDDELPNPFPLLDVRQYQALHLDGHQPDAALHYAQLFRKLGLLTSLDGGRLRSNTDELLRYIDVAIVSKDLCEQMHYSPEWMLTYLMSRGCKIGGITLGADGLFWFDENYRVQHMPALHVPPERVIDTNGAGDIFHGAYLYSRLTWPDKRWREHFTFARAASTFAVQHLGNEASCPTLNDVMTILDHQPSLRIA